MKMTAKVPAKAGDPTRALVKAIAMDIGKEVVAYIRVMYPQAMEVCPRSTFPLSVRNCIYNEIMAALEVTDEDQIIARLRTRKQFRDRWVKQWRDIRKASRKPRPAGRQALRDK